MQWPFTKKEQPLLKPGRCECKHPRCAHAAGKGRCHAMSPPNSTRSTWANCACQIFIRAAEDDDDDRDGGVETPGPNELERLYKL